MKIEVELPKFIAFVGHPTCGKTTAAEILCKTFGCKIVDSGLPLREIAMKYLGLTSEQVFTQEGKASMVYINGQAIQVRKILGDLGQKFEDMFGDQILPLMSKNTQCNDVETTYIDPSCRKTQGWFWKRHNGVVIGINNPLAKPSPFAFDWFDETSVDYWLDNDGLARGLTPELAMQDLQDKLENLIVKISVEGTIKLVA